MKQEETMKRFCNNCKRETLQVVRLYNPDNSEEGEVWECGICKENTSWASEKLQKFDKASHDNNSFIL